MQRYKLVQGRFAIPRAPPSPCRTRSLPPDSLSSKSLLQGTLPPRASFEKAFLKGASLQRSSLQRTLFKGASLQTASLQRTFLNEISRQKASLQRLTSKNLFQDTSLQTIPGCPQHISRTPPRPPPGHSRHFPDVPGHSKHSRTFAGMFGNVRTSGHARECPGGVRRYVREICPGHVRRIWSEADPRSAHAQPPCRQPFFKEPPSREPPAESLS